MRAATPASLFKRCGDLTRDPLARQTIKLGNDRLSRGPVRIAYDVASENLYFAISAPGSSELSQVPPRRAEEPVWRRLIQTENNYGRLTLPLLLPPPSVLTGHVASLTPY